VCRVFLRRMQYIRRIEQLHCDRNRPYMAAGSNKIGSFCWGMRGFQASFDWTQLEMMNNNRLCRRLNSFRPDDATFQELWQIASMWLCRYGKIMSFRVASSDKITTDRVVIYIAAAKSCIRKMPPFIRQ
jgi:hypothetical protein